MRIGNHTPLIGYTNLIIDAPPEMLLRLYFTCTLCAAVCKEQRGKNK